MVFQICLKLYSNVKRQLLKALNYYSARFFLIFHPIQSFLQRLIQFIECKQQKSDPLKDLHSNTVMIYSLAEFDKAHSISTRYFQFPIHYRKVEENYTIYRGEHWQQHPALKTIIFMPATAYVQLNPVYTDCALPGLLTHLTSDYQIILATFPNAPQHKFPAPVLHLQKTISHLIQQHQRYLIDTSNMVLSGYSCGGTMTIPLGLYFASQSVFFKSLLCVSPVFDYSGTLQRDEVLSNKWEGLQQQDFPFFAPPFASEGCSQDFIKISTFLDLQILWLGLQVSQQGSTQTQLILFKVLNWDHTSLFKSPKYQILDQCRQNFAFIMQTLEKARDKSDKQRTQLLRSVAQKDPGASLCSTCRSRSEIECKTLQALLIGSLELTSKGLLSAYVLFEMETLMRQLIRKIIGFKQQIHQERIVAEEATQREENHPPPKPHPSSSSLLLSMIIMQEERKLREEQIKKEESTRRSRSKKNNQKM